MMCRTRLPLVARILLYLCLLFVGAGLVKVAWWRAHVRIPATRFRRLPAFASVYVPPRQVTVLVPPDYDASPTRHYPVLYLQDGESVFEDAAPVLFSSWSVDRTADRLTRDGMINPIIIVAVCSLPGKRDAEYTFSRGADGKGGGGEAYARMLITELKPFVDAHYRTLPDASHTTLGGASLGGLFALTAGLRHPETFGNVIVLSPATWWANHAALREVAALPPISPSVTRRPVIYLGAGTAEGTIYPDAVRLDAALRGRGWRAGTTLSFNVAPGAGHTRRAWRDQMTPALKFVNGARVGTRVSPPRRRGGA